MDFSCGQAVDNLRGRKLVLNEMNKHCLDLILGTKGSGNCCTKENLRCINSSINNMF